MPTKVGRKSTAYGDLGVMSLHALVEVLDNRKYVLCTFYCMQLVQRVNKSTG